MRKRTTKAALAMITVWLSLLVFSSSVSASIQDNATPDNDPFYDPISISDPGVVLLSDAETSTDKSAAVSYNADESVITLDYSITKAMNGKIPVPNAFYSSIVTIKNNTAQEWELDMSKSMKIFLWGYITEAAYNTYSYYKTVLDQWIMFKFNIIEPDGSNTSVSPFAAITDYSGSAGYHFPSEEDSHVMLDDTSSLEGDYYAKATLPVPNIVLKPEESMQIPWGFAMSFYANNATRNMQMDFDFRLVFNRIGEQTYSYAVNYYQNAVDAGNLLGSKSGITPFAADYQLTQSDIAADLGENWMNAYRPEGYESGKAEAYPIISVDETKNVVNVVYYKTAVPPADPNDSPESPDVKPPQTGQTDFHAVNIILLFGSLGFIVLVQKKREVKY